MLRSISVFVVLLALICSPLTTLAQEATPSTSATGSACATPDTSAEIATPTAAVKDDAALAAIAKLPVDKPSAEVSRGENAELGKLTLSLPGGLSAVKIKADVKSNSAGPIGRVERTERELVFSFTEVTYDVAAMDVLMGGRIEPQTIRLDPAQPSTLCVDLETGVITRNFHWLLTGTNVQYDGSDTVGLGDHGRASIAAVTVTDADHYAVRMLTHWQSEIDLKTWSIDGNTLPSGKIAAAAEFDGTYDLDFSK